MGYENLNIELKGFKPSRKIERLLTNVADSIHWQSPSDACLKVVCEQTKGAIKAYCRIVSHAGVFVSEVVGDSPEKCIRKLEKEIQKKLNRWKKSRLSFYFGNQFNKAS